MANLKPVDEIREYFETCIVLKESDLSGAKRKRYYDDKKIDLKYWFNALGVSRTRFSLHRLLPGESYAIDKELMQKLNRVTILKQLQKLKSVYGVVYKLIDHPHGVIELTRWL